MLTCDCFTGTPGDRDYQPKGTTKTLHGLNVYQALAAAPAKGEILFLPDAFGLATHNKVLADEYAAFGYNTTIVDYFEGDALPDIVMSYTPGTDLDSYDNFSPEEKETIRNTDMAAWVSRHPQPKISSVLHPFFVAFRKAVGPSENLHLLGHCFGGKYALRLARSNQITSAIAMHPVRFPHRGLALSHSSRTTLERINRYSDMCTGHNSRSSTRKTGRTFNDQSWSAAPMETVASNSAITESDVFTPTLIADTFEAAAKWKVYYKISVYGGTVHGFASRADRSNSAEMRPYRSSFEDSLSWMKLVNGP
ncbi:hypothetical protein B0T10DRAFT_553845 [Thelonectria olida]|uniref:Dienelactone hydrolase domain-containing protein n=1 Tax=Thelonectria olida TaxID=1576542 RepID=A0A9P9AJE7_9HYPO|nr:hypothetical protein B0T10DRAFT_553845 [Thelonectria olida]